MKFSFLLTLLMMVGLGCHTSTSQESNNQPTIDYVGLSERFLLATRYGEDLQPYIDSLKTANIQQLKVQLKDNETRKTFWINNYNSFVQYALKTATTNYENRDAFFNQKTITLAGTEFSLNELENGFLRLKLDQIPQDFKSMAVDTLDYRIHFALNCGAQSCPPIAFYNAENIEEQLSIAEESYIAGSFIYDPVLNEMEITELFNWYADDFGGQSGIYAIATKNGILPNGLKPTLTYAPYNWNKYVEYVKENE